MSSTNGCKMTPTLKRPINIFYWQSQASLAAACSMRSPPSHHRSVKMPRWESRPLREALSFRTFGWRRSRSVSFQVQLHPSINTPTAHLRCAQTGLLTRNINSLVSRPYVQSAEGCGPINTCPVAPRLAFSAADATLKRHKVLQPRKRRRRNDFTFSE